MQQTVQTPPAPQAAKPKPPVPPPDFQEAAIATMNGPALVSILTSSTSSDFQKAKACQRAGELGAKEAVPALAALLTNERLATYARYGLEPITDPSVDEALRATLSKLSGNLRIGVINSLAKRRDAKAGPLLSRLIYDSDAGVAQAAAAALGRVGGPAAIKDLQSALGKTTGLTRVAVADGCLACAEDLLAQGNRDQALKLYAFLTASDVPKPARLAAMQGIIREETSTGRPR